MLSLTYCNQISPAHSDSIKRSFLYYKTILLAKSAIDKEEDVKENGGYDRDERNPDWNHLVSAERRNVPASL